MGKNRSIICEIESAHNRTSGNYLAYSTQGLTSSIPSWTVPYKKPFILFHEDQDGKIIGRILKAEIRDSILLPGYKALVHTVRVFDKDGIDGIINGKYLTVSIGAKSSEVECSICHKRVDPKHVCHTLGKYYNGQLCVWEVNSMVGEELSAVIVPSDKYAQIINWRYEDEPESVVHLVEKQAANDTETIIKEKQKERVFKMNGNEPENVQTQQASPTPTNVTDTTPEQNKDFLIKENARLQNELSQALTEKSVLENRIDLLQQDYNTEKQSRVAAETALAEYKIKERESIINEFVAIRENLQLRPLTDEEMKNKTVEYLEAAIEDMKQDIIFKESQTAATTKTEPEPTPAPAPAQNIQVQNTQIQIQESDQTQDESAITVSKVNKIISNLI